MHAAHGERIVKLRASAHAPRLSILAPFHRDDPAPLLRALARAGADARVEIILVDDGSGSAALLAHVVAEAERLAAPVTIVVWGENRGRAQARNRLIAEARARHVLFLDADMIPARADFLDAWLDLIAAEDPGVAFGGFTVAKAHATRSRALHYHLSTRSECRDAAARARDPAQFTATSNLLVRRALLAATPFDEAFVGWGWEDVDWALRAAERTPIRHVDIAAVHGGLDDVDTLLRKYRQAGPNYARLAAKHPQAVARFASYRAARALQRVPAMKTLRAACAWLARDPAGVTPMRARFAAIKLFRAAVYAEHLP